VGFTHPAELELPVGALRKAPGLPNSWQRARAIQLNGCSRGLEIPGALILTGLIALADQLRVTV